MDFQISETLRKALSELTNTERQHVLEVLRRDSLLRANHCKRIHQLRNELILDESKLTRDPKKCSGCGNRLVFFFRLTNSCSGCGLKFCNSCIAKSHNKEKSYCQQCMKLRYLIALSNKWLEFQRYMSTFRKNEHESSASTDPSAILSHIEPDDDIACSPKSDGLSRDNDANIPEKNILLRDKAMNIFLEYHGPYLKPLQAAKALNHHIDIQELKNRDVTKVENHALQQPNDDDVVDHDVKRVITEISEYVCEVLEAEISENEDKKMHKCADNLEDNMKDLSMKNKVERKISQLVEEKDSINRLKAMKLVSKMKSITEDVNECPSKANDIVFRNNFHEGTRLKIERPKTLIFQPPNNINGNKSTRNTYSFGYNVTSPESPSKNNKNVDTLGSRCTNRGCLGFNIDSPRNIIQSPRKAVSPVFLIEHLGLSSSNRIVDNTERFVEMPSAYFAMPNFKVAL